MVISCEDAALLNEDGALLSEDSNNNNKIVVN